MSGDSLGNKALKGSVWAAVDKFGSMSLQFFTNLVLSHLLLPEDFGTIGILSIFLLVAQSLIDGGFGASLIQKKEPTQDDYSTIFWWNIGLAILLYAVLFIASPIISRFYRIDTLLSVLRVIGVVLITNSLSVIQANRLRKQLAFGKLAFVNITAYIIGAVVGVMAAVEGYGVWSLVLMQLSYSLFTAILLWIITHWRPSFVFSVTSFKKLFSYGGYLLTAGLLQEICKNFPGIIIGRKFNTTQMGYYSQAAKLDSVASSSLSGIIVQVMFPVYSSIQDEQERLIEMLKMNVRVISILVFPLMGGLILTAEFFFDFLYGEIWIPSSPYFQILCVGGIFVCLQNINFYAVAAKGKSRQLFFWSFYKWGALLVLMLIGMNFGMKGLVWSMVVSSVNIWATNALLVQKYVGLKFLSQIEQILPAFFAVAISLAISLLLNQKIELSLLVSVCIYAVLCVGIPLLFRFKSVDDVFTLVSYLRNKNNRK